MKQIGQMTDAELIDSSIALDRLIKDQKRSLENLKAELQARGLRQMEDQNIRYVKYYGSYGSAAVADTMMLDTLNMERLTEYLGEGLIRQKVKSTTETKYKYDPKLERALKAIFTGDYTFEYGLEEFLEQMPIRPDEKQKKLLLKKLKGDYRQDKATLLTVLGYMERGQDEREVDAPDLDVELWYIYRIKNAELIRAFLPEEHLEEIMENVKKCILVESKTTITIDYKEEESNDH